MASAYRIETEFVRVCAENYFGEIGFTPTAEAELIEARLSWVDIYQVLRGGRVVWSDKEEAEGAKSILVGTTCDGDKVRLTIRWSYAPARLLVVSIERI